ncbi:hypothetical protein SCLCIDRAFT_22528 [Scleroderma citrinum Foug A]|uniref:Uncharacterized protein n=1 Tax=Scleroderma citrinum Foug A TaxID=1036808 RepID=A0A0C2ZVY6_9AGAM|nr:hypothetical protein SCLCIDRAFT_22528 [Scleroderma citrinum Foug A]
MLTLSDLVFCPIGPRSLPHALGSFPAPSPMLSNQYLARTTSLKPYGPSPVFLTYANLPEPVSLSSMVALPEPTQHLSASQPLSSLPRPASDLVP